jgi:hypothetical protein
MHLPIASLALVTFWHWKEVKVLTLLKPGKDKKMFPKFLPDQPFVHYGQTI